MKFDIFSCSTFNTIFENNIPNLVGSQCAYPILLQEPLINMFFSKSGSENDYKGEAKSGSNSGSDSGSDSDDNIIPFCFKLNNIYLYPKQIINSNNISLPIIVVSDEFFELYFRENQTNIDLHVVYNIPNVDLLVLKSPDYDIPDIEVATFLLTEYFNSSSVVSIGQQFSICNNHTDPIDQSDHEQSMTVRFEVEDIKYKDEIKADIKMRFDELNKTFEFNDKLSTIYGTPKPESYTDCTSHVINYGFHFHKTDNQNPTLGYLVNNEVKIDFKLAERPPVPIINTPTSIINTPTSIINTLTESKLKSSVFDSVGHILGRSDEETHIDLPNTNEQQNKPLTVDEIRKKRLQFLEKIAPTK